MTLFRSIKDLFKILASLSVFQVLLLANAESDTLVGLSVFAVFFVLVMYGLRKLHGQ